MIRRILVLLVAVGAVAFAVISLTLKVGALKAPGVAGQPAGTAPPAASLAGSPPAGPLPMVEVVRARAETWVETRNVLGNVKAARRINVVSDVAGRIVTVAAPAAKVQKGNPLILLDDSVEQAQLRQKIATFELARSNARRADALVQRAVSEAARESARTDEIRALSEVEVLRATIRKFSVQAPFEGKVGFHDLVPGQYVQPGQVLFSVQDTSSFTVEFSVPESDIPMLADGASVDILGERNEPVGVARVCLISPEANTANRRVSVRAELPGSAPLRVGTSVRVSYNAEPAGETVTLPDIAVVHNAYGQSVFVVRDRTVDQRFIEVLGRQNGKVAVARGLSPGETVVAAGQMRLYPGARVRIAEAGMATPPVVSAKPSRPGE